MRHALLLAALWAGLSAASVAAGPVELNQKYESLKPLLASNAFGRPLVLDSLERKDGLAGDIYAVVNRPFESAAPALTRPDNWCDILLLVFNVKQCRLSGAGLQIHIGRKHDEPLEQTTPMAFSYGVASSSADYIRIRLSSAEGPLGTREYVIALEAVPVGKSQSFIHLSYSYGYGTAARLAMQAYLGTTGRDKVGFTVERPAAGGAPRYVDGVRGVVERNTMRYYLAIESFLGALDRPRELRFESSARDWFAATERYARQLHEMNEAEYLAMKRREYARQAQLPVTAGGSG